MANWNKMNCCHDHHANVTSAKWCMGLYKNVV